MTSNINNTKSFEDSLVNSGLIDEDQLKEIKNTFILCDQDKNGQLSYEEVANLMQRLYNRAITAEEAGRLISKIDINYDGKIEWLEFLKCLAEWLKTFEDGSSPLKGSSKREQIHSHLKKFFLQDVIQNPNDAITFIEEGPSEAQYGNSDLELRPCDWNFEGERVIISKVDKLRVYYAEIAVLAEKFRFISSSLECSNDFDICEGLDRILNLLRVSSYFTNSSERHLISHFTIKLFDYLGNSIIFKIFKFLNEFETKQNFAITNACLKLITIFAMGPRVPGIPVSSPYHHFNYKIVLNDNNIMQTLLKIIEKTEDNLLKSQAFLALGFLIQGFPDLRDRLILQNGISIILNQFNSDRTEKEMEKLSWLMSLIAGVSQHRPPNDINIVNTLLDYFRQLLTWRDNERIYTNSLLALSILVPVSNNLECIANTWKNIPFLLSNPRVSVKRAALQCLSSVVSINDTIELLDKNIMSLVGEFLYYSSDSLKVETCQLLDKMIRHGQINVILFDSAIIKNILAIIYQDPKVRSFAIKLIATLSEYKNPTVNSCLLLNEFINCVTVNLDSFKEYDALLKDIYGYCDPSYNFDMLYDMLLIIRNLVETSFSFTDYLVVLNRYLNFGILEKIRNLIDMIFDDIANRKIDCLILETEKQNINTSFNMLLNCLHNFFNLQLTTNPSLQTVLNQIKALSEIVNMNTRKIDEFILNFNKKSISIEVICVPIINSALTKKFTVEADITFLELLLNVECLFSASPIILFTKNSNGNKIELNSDGLWKKLLEARLQEAYLSGTTTTVIELLLDNPIKDSIGNYVWENEIFSSNQNITNIIRGAHTNLKEINKMADYLKNKSHLNADELNGIYQRFINVTSKRYANREDGSVSFIEFKEIVRDTPIFKSEETIMYIFNMLDTTQGGLEKGLVDFRDFACFLGIMKQGSQEDRLRIAFKAYDIDGDGFLDSNEIYKLLRTTLAVSGYIYQEMELQEKVRKIFEVADINKDGKLSYTEFKQAIATKQLIINDFWLSTLSIESTPNYYRNYGGGGDLTLRRQDAKSPVQFYKGFY